MTTDQPTIPAPHAPISEKTLLALMFRNPANIARAAADGITAPAFYLPAHRYVLEYLEKARASGALTQDGEIDLTLLVQAALSDGVLERMGGAADVYGLSTYSWDSTGWDHHVKAMRDAFALRIAQSASESIAGACDAEEALQLVTDTLEAIKQASAPRSRSMNAQESCDSFLRAYLAAAENGDLPGTSSGIGEIDALTGGLRPGELWVVSGPSSSGKSVLMYQIASEFLGLDKRVPIFSAELMVPEIVGRLVTLRARVTYDAITQPRHVAKSEIAKIQAGVTAIRETALHIDASGGQSIASIEAEAERIKDIHGRVDLIVVDYIQIIKGVRNRGDSREQEVASISGGLKQLAKKLNCPVITGSQLNDDGKTRESRAIEQDADVLMVIDKDSVLMKKVRNGQRDVHIPIKLDGAQQRFRHYIIDSSR